MDYKQKYLKYKAKYLELKGGDGGMKISQLNEQVKNGLYYPVYIHCSKGLGNCIKRTEYHKIVSFEESGKDNLKTLKPICDDLTNIELPYSLIDNQCTVKKNKFFGTSLECPADLKYKVKVGVEDVGVEGRYLINYDDQKNSPKDPPNPIIQINVLRGL